MKKLFTIDDKMADRIMGIKAEQDDQTGLDILEHSLDCDKHETDNDLI